MFFRSLKTNIAHFLLIYILLLPQVTMASNIHLGDNYFSQKLYKLATKEYLHAAEIGNPRAYYQLGSIYFQGLGTEVNYLQALLWFSLSANHSFDNSKELTDHLLAKIPEQQKPQAIKLVSLFQKHYGKQSVNDKYYPELIAENLDLKVQFKGLQKLNEENLITDFSIVDQSVDMPSLSESLYNEDGSEVSKENIDEDELFNAPFFLIADYDIADDGSIRQISPVQIMGNLKQAAYNLSISTLARPTFAGKPVSFINRSYLGVANINKFQARKEYQPLFLKIRGQVAKFSRSESPLDVFKHAMLLNNYPWLAQDEDDVIKLLEKSAKQGVTSAQYELGLKLYREQKDIKQAIHWISEASRNGLSQAKYQLAKILLDSPWVVKDERKALFWFEEAAKQEHVFANQKIAKLKLLSKNSKLHDLQGASVYLNEISQAAEQDPEYYYLQAIAHNQMRPRKLSHAVVYMRLAIENGEELNWDVTSWQQQLNRWTSGGVVTIQEL